MATCIYFSIQWIWTNTKINFTSGNSGPYASLFKEVFWDFQWQNIAWKKKYILAPHFMECKGNVVWVWVVIESQVITKWLVTIWHSFWFWHDSFDTTWPRYDSVRVQLVERSFWIIYINIYIYITFFPENSCKIPGVGPISSN